MGNFKKAMLTNLPLPYDICMGNQISGQYQIKREIIKYEGHFPWLQNFELHEGVKGTQPVQVQHWDNFATMQMNDYK